MVGAIAFSCQDDELYNSQADSIEGVPTILSLSVNLNEMKGMSRAAIDDTKAGNIKNIWVGIYNVKTGKCTYNNLFTKDDLTPKKAHEGTVTLSDIKTESGDSYIVAVANVLDNYGITDNEELQKVAKEEVDNGTNQFNEHYGGPLKALLKNADTWEKYKSISFMLTAPTNIDFSASDNLAMSGSYYNSQKDSDPNSWYDENGNPEVVNIPVPSGESTSVTLQGSIHLRRMISYIKFNIIAGNNVTVEPVSWRVYNNPIITYLQEREKNAADVSTYFDGRDPDPYGYYKINHGISNLSYDFNEGSLTDATGQTIGEEGSSFDFYQFENKQTAVNVVTSYQDREKEYKDENEENTSLYECLGSKESPAPGTSGTNTGNFASYVTFRLKVTYWVVSATTNTDPGKETPVAPGTYGAIRREGYANYTVHLGYIEGTGDSEKARDFNCRRNMKYTYNVTVKSLNHIIVEAFKNEENQPGAEGDVTDVKDVGRIELDAHYATFNIKLTYTERRALKWMIEAPYNNVTYSYYSDDYREGGTLVGESNKLSSDQFYNWIHFKPTTDEKTLRRYKDSETDTGLWTLEDLADVNHMGIDKDGKEVAYNENDENNQNNQELWYTVFVDEYVYHKDEKGNSTDQDGKEGGWHAYVNQAPRIVWIACDNRHISNDKESLYMNSKYMISQNSILTYYSSTNRTPENTALGLERENETFGLNLAWSRTAWQALTSNGGTTSIPNVDNGRYNVWYYLSGGIISSKVSTEGRYWSAMAATKEVEIKGEKTICLEPFERNAINNGQLVETTGKIAPVFMPASIKGDLYTNNNSGWDAYNPFSGNSISQYEVITACMSRNRDENGNGKIDVNEVKWYVPTTGKYARIILGRAVIPKEQRLMNFDETPAYGFKQPNGTFDSKSSNFNTRYHYASSDKKIVWAEEGTSTSDWLGADWSLPAWQIRCVRNLGVNLGQVVENDPVTPAYSYDETSRRFSLTYYEEACKRAPQSDALPVHDVQSAANQPAAVFEVASNNCTADNTGIVFNNQASKMYFRNETLQSYSAANWKEACNANSICGQYAQKEDRSDLGTWRVPNQKELVMMRREKLLTFNDGSNPTDNSDMWVSCTQEHYDKKTNGTRRFFLFFKNRGTINDDSNSIGPMHVRCVRDVIEAR